MSSNQAALALESGDADCYPEGVEDLRITEHIIIPGWELWFEVSRSAGPGGQHANKTSTRVTLCWVPQKSSAFRSPVREQVLRGLQGRLTQEGVLRLSSDAYRSQLRNKEDTRERLVELVKAAMVKRRRRIKTRPTRSSQRRRVDEKKARGAIKKTRGKVRGED